MKLFDLVVTVNTGLVGGAALIGIMTAPTFISSPQPVETHAQESPSAVVAGAHTSAPIQIVQTPTPTPTPPRVVTDPVRIEIPNMGINTTVVHVGITTENGMEVPQDGNQVGWFTGSPKPGEEQSRAAILTGHFDTTSGAPAIFNQLETIEYDDEIRVTSADGSIYSFRVTDSVSHPLEAFPTEIVYGETQGTYLKLITCDGIWNHSTGSYSERLVVTARLDQIIDHPSESSNDETSMQ